MAGLRQHCQPGSSAERWACPAIPFLGLCRQLDAAWFRRRVGVVSQDPRLFSLTVAENIAYGCPEATQVRCWFAGSCG